MNIKNLLVLSFALLVFGVMPVHAHAANPFATITFPIPELGNCASQSDCKAYCDVAENVQACISWGQANGLLPKVKPVNPTVTAINDALKNNPGPGGCTTLDQCKTYCSDSAHQTECVAFAKEHHLLSKDDQKKADTAGKLDALIAAGGPGGCTTRDACKTYCQDPAHRDECIAFAKKAGLIGDEEGQRLSNLPKTGPGGCTSPQDCATFCSQEANHAICLNFAKEHRMTGRGDMGSTTPGEGDDHRMMPPRPFKNGEGSTTPPWPPRPNGGGDWKNGSSTGPHPYNPGGEWHGSSTPPGGPGVRYPDNENEQGGGSQGGEPHQFPPRPLPPKFLPHGGGEGVQGFNDDIVSGMTASVYSAFSRGVSALFGF